MPISFEAGRRSRFRLSGAALMAASGAIRTAQASGRKVHELPVHHKLLDHLEAYVAGAGVTFEPKTPLFQAVRGRTGALSGQRMSRTDAYAMVRRRAAAAGLPAEIGNHSFRGTGITTFLLNDGTLELAQEMANHSSPRTTKLYDRRQDQVTQEAIERIRIE